MLHEQIEQDTYIKKSMNTSAIATLVVEMLNYHAFLFVCGKGNNAGDGFIAASILCNEGFKVRVVTSEKTTRSISKMAFRNSYLLPFLRYWHMASI